MSHAFANILLSGPCNLRCPDCIGGQLRAAASNTLALFPLPGLARFTAALRARAVRQVSVTGLDTEPMLYRRTHDLVARLRAEVPGVHLSLHTNGTRVLAGLDAFHAYDRATISFPSRDPDTCRQMTGSARVLDLPSIVERSRIPIKISILMTPHNRAEIPSLLQFFRSLGLNRVVLRRRYGDTSSLDPLPGEQPCTTFAGNPVYDLQGLEVTVWDFGQTHLPCINLLPDGTVRDGYALKEVARA